MNKTRLKKLSSRLERLEASYRAPQSELVLTPERLALVAFDEIGFLRAAICISYNKTENYHWNLSELPCSDNLVGLMNRILERMIRRHEYFSTLSKAEQKELLGQIDTQSRECPQLSRLDKMAGTASSTKDSAVVHAFKIYDHFQASEPRGFSTHSGWFDTQDTHDFRWAQAVLFEAGILPQGVVRKCL